jgi:hypothetical protein
MKQDGAIMAEMAKVAETVEDGGELPMSFDLPKNELHNASESNHSLETGDPQLLSYSSQTSGESQPKGTEIIIDSEKTPYS